MTNEEAIKELDGEYAFNDDFVGAIRLGIKALEKQVPKMVDKRYAMSWCPNCEDMIDRRTTKPIKYCINCGQALKWNDLQG